MSDRPIIFSGPMIRVLLAGAKTQTRRVLRKKAALNAAAVFDREFLTRPGNVDLIGCAIGDWLWVREAFRGARGYEGQPPARWGNKPIWYVADGAPPDARWSYLSDKSHSSIHMPRWASRLTLVVTGVKVERLQEISREDAIAEGCESPLIGTEAPAPAHGVYLADERTSFAQLWNRLHGEGAWDANPFVVAITFAVHKANIDAMEKAA